MSKIMLYILGVVISLAMLLVNSYKISQAKIDCPTSTPTATETMVPTDTPTATATSTETPISTTTDTPTATPTDTPIYTPIETPTVTPSETPTTTPTNTPIITQTDTPVNTPTPEVDPSPSPTSTVTQPPNTPTPTATTYTPTPTATTIPTSTHAPTETPFPPVPADAFGAYKDEYPGEFLGVVSMDDYGYNLYDGVKASSGSLLLPNTLHGAAAYKGTIWAHRMWDTGWLKLKVGDLVLITMDEGLYLYKIQSSTYQPYGKYFSDTDSHVYKYIATCYSDDDGEWTGIQLYELKLIRFYEVPIIIRKLLNG